MNLMSLNEAAHELRISIHTMRAWTRQKKIPIVRLGRRILLRREDLEEFVGRSVIEAEREK